MISSDSWSGQILSCLLSLRSEEWSKVTSKDREKLGIKVEDDGDFW